jgi:hypothetical protein
MHTLKFVFNLILSCCDWILNLNLNHQMQSKVQKQVAACRHVQKNVLDTEKR